MSKWTLAAFGELIGIIIFMASDEFYGVSGVGDVAHLFGVGLPFALLGLVIGAIFFKKKNKDSDKLTTDVEI